MTQASSSRVASLVRTLSRVSVVRFGIVGVSNAALSFSVFWCLLHAMPAAVAQSFAYTAGIFWSYYWNRRWTFQSQERVGREASRFIGLQIGFMLLSSALLGLLVDRAHLASGPSWLAVAVLITVLNFVASRYWAFRKA